MKILNSAYLLIIPAALILFMRTKNTVYARKRINVRILSLLFILPFIQSIYPQGWVQQSSGITQYTTCVFFLNQQTGWATADQGIVLKTTNGGTNWNLLTTGTGSALYSVKFFDQLTGWVSGSSGTLLKTTDGGNNWTLTDFTQGNLKLFFLNSQTGWILGTNGSTIVYATTNGGTNWIQYNTGYSVLSSNIFFADQNSGWISTVGGKVLRTLNGGANWTSSDVLLTEAFSLYFTSSTTGYVAASGGVLKTTNGGVNWTIYSPPGGGLLLSVNFINQQTGWLCGTSGKIYVTTNAGGNWVSQSSSVPSEDLNYIFFSGPNGWACGSNGTIISTSTGGFTLPLRPGNLTASAVSASQVNLNWIDSSSNEQYFKIERSTNGSSWVLIDSVNPNVTSYQNTGLEPGTTYFYRVYASAWFGNSLPTSSVSALTFPSSPGLFTPVNNSTGLSLTPQLSWLPVQSAVTYRLQVSTDSLFNTLIINDSTLTQLTYNVPSGILNNGVKYHWRVRAKNISGSGAYSPAWNFTTGLVGVSQNGVDIPKVYKLYNNYPNPFNPSTKIRFDLPLETKGSIVKLVIYNLLGEHVSELVNSQMQPGSYEVDFDGSSLSSGVYLYKLTAGNYSDIKKMMLIK